MLYIYIYMGYIYTYIYIYREKIATVIGDANNSENHTVSIGMESERCSA